MVNPAQDAIDFQDKALAFAQAGKNTEARENFLISLKLNPSSAQGWNNLGTLSFFENKLDEAKTQYERAIEEDPKYADPYYNLALLLAKQGDLKGARARADEAKKLGKDLTPLKEILK
jgi:tetratricopeptide (TPR) repeat protein